MVAGNKGQFKPGNQLAKGNPGPVRRNFLTQELISQLNEIDPRTNKQKFGMVVEQLVRLATGFVVKEYVYVKGKKTDKYTEREVAGDLPAIKYVFDRLEGSPVSAVSFDAGADGKVTLVFEKADEKL
jgi:hypothetical protein